MRTRVTHINVRTTQQEKARFEHNAQRCGLSLSEYLRKLANGHEPKTVPPLEYRELMNMIADIHTDFCLTGEEKYAALLAGVLLEMQAALSPEGGGYGHHQNLAGA